MRMIEQNLVVDSGGRILGRLERWDVPHTLGKRCPKCNQLVPVRDWRLHQEVCHTIGWGRYHNPIASFQATTTSKRHRVNREIEELAALL